MRGEGWGRGAAGDAGGAHAPVSPAAFPMRPRSSGECLRWDRFPPPALPAEAAQRCPAECANRPAFSKCFKFPFFFFFLRRGEEEELFPFTFLSLYDTERKLSTGHVRMC